MLYLYNSFTPNTDENTYYLFSTFSSYIQGIASHLIKTLDVDNYRYNNNEIKIKIDTTITEAIADTLTYAIITNNGFNRCYFINNVIIQSGYATLICSVDLWASYIYKASIDDIIVNKCNRNIGIGVYDTIVAVKNSYAFEGRNQLSDNYSIMVLVNFNTYQSQLTGQTISRTTLNVMNINNLKQLLATKGITYANQRELINIAIRVLGGIYVTSGGTDVEVIGAYLVPYYVPSYEYPLQTINFKSKFSVGSTNVDDFVEYTLVGNAFSYITTLTIPNYTPNKLYYYGVRLRGLQLKNYTEAMPPQIIWNVNTTSIQVMIKQGNDYEDITEQFKLEITFNSSLQTQSRIIAKSIIDSVNVMQGFLKSFNKEGGVSVAKLGSASLGALGSFASKFLDKNINNSIGKGDALTNYISESDSTAIVSPFCYTTYESINDEEALARINGATFNKKVDSLASIFNYDLLGTGTLLDTYIQCQCSISNIPYDALKLIKGQLNKGIYAQIL